MLNSFRLVSILLKALSAWYMANISVVVVRSRRELGAAFVHTAQSIGAVPHRIVVEDLGPRPLAGVTLLLEQLLSISQCSGLLVDTTEHNVLTLLREMIAKVATYRLRHAHLIELSRQRSRTIVYKRREPTARWGTTLVDGVKNGGE